MHQSSMDRMREFVNGPLLPPWLDGRDENFPLTVLDVGSIDVCGTYRALFPEPMYKYTGLDLEPGKNVDIVADHPYYWGVRGKMGDINTYQFDVIISGQCLEHVYDTHKWIREVYEHLKPGGICCIIAPWQWEEHKFPVDCWRILPDGMRFLLGEIGGLKIEKVWKQENDTIGVATKPLED